MAILQSFVRALGLLGAMPLGTAAPAGSVDPFDADAMLQGKQPIRLRQGWPWEASSDEFSDFAGTSTASAPCSAESPVGMGPIVSNPDTAQAFLNNGTFQQTSFNLGVTNNTYDVVTLNFSAAVQPISTDPYIGYLGWMNMPSYIPYNCANLCTAWGFSNPTNCTSYNIYYLRSPTVAPSTGSDTSCPNPPSMTHIVCAFFANATQWWHQKNFNQTRGQFQVIITGSNQYNKKPNTL